MPQLPQSGSFDGPSSSTFRLAGGSTLPPMSLEPYAPPTTTWGAFDLGARFGSSRSPLRASLPPDAD